ncbi:alcohol dehydrogenase catalytic domain-containing protein, partial [Rhodococcus opacus]
MSRRVVARAYGGPEVLALVDAEAVNPAPGEVVIEVRAIGVNPIDYKLYSGAFGADPDALPLRLGSEAAGVVAEVGDAAAG